jgi:penicillin-insensitive murein endopeptidase
VQIRALRIATLSVIASASLATGCAQAPNPLVPSLTGSIGLPHRGVLVGGVALEAGSSLRFLRDDERHFAIPRFTASLERAADAVQRERPGLPLVVGDLSIKSGGRLLPHLSHRSGRDADLLLYWTTLEGAPVETPGFIRVGSDGLGWDPVHKRFLRFDVEREWLLVKSLVTDEDGRIQWIFAHHTIEAWLVEWARARGEDGETIERAEEVLAEPHPGGLHEDHVHVRTACAPEELATGCEPSGPTRAWLRGDPASPDGDETLDLVQLLMTPLPEGAAREARSDATP